MERARVLISEDRGLSPRPPLPPQFSKSLSEPPSLQNRNNYPLPDYFNWLLLELINNVCVVRID